MNNTTFENKVLRAQILLLEADRVFSDERYLIGSEVAETLTEISKKAEALRLALGEKRTAETQQKPVSSELLTYKELAQLMQCSESSLQNAVSRRKIPFIRLGGTERGSVRFRRADIDQWLAEKTTKARA